MKNKVNIRPLKEFVLKRIPKNWPLREIILSEEDEIEITIFLARIGVWLKIADISAKRKEGNDL